MPSPSPVDDLGQAGKERLRGVDRGQLLALEVAVLVGVGDLESCREDAASILGRGVSVLDVDIKPDLSDGELNVAVGDLTDLDPFGATPPASDAGRWSVRSLGREGHLELEVDRRPREELSELVRIECIVAVLVGGGEGVRGRSRTRPSESLPSGLPGTFGSALVIFLEQEPGRSERRLTGDQLDDRRERGAARLGCSAGPPSGR